MKLKSGLVLTISAAVCGLLNAQEYEGPTVLSRSGGGIHAYGARVGEDAKLRIFAQAEAVYDYGFLPIATNSKGVINSFGGQFGYQGTLGVYGTKRWRRASLGLDYTGTYHGYTKQTYYNGAENFLGIEFGDQIDRATLITGSLTAGTSNRALGLSGNLIGSPLGNLLPTSDIFDARTYFINGGMGISHQLNSRLGFELRGDAYRVERHSSSLVSVQGYSPKASLSYRVNRRWTVGSLYNFIHYDYPKSFGESNVQVAMGFVRYQINRNWNFETQLGAFVADTAGTRQIAADPIVQQLLGVKTLTEAFSRVVVLPNAQLSLTGKTGNSWFLLSAYRGVGAGNGITLATTEQTGQFTYRYVFSKSLTGYARASYTGAAGLSSAADRYTTYSSGVGIDYNSANSLSYTFHGQFRRTSSHVGTNFDFNSYQVGLGVGWNQRDIPLIH